MKLIYSAGIWLYRQGVRLAALWGGKAAKLNKGLGETFGILRKHVDPYGKYVWIHAASLGEFEQGRPLMEQIRRERPDLKVLLTFFSPSGYEVRKDYTGADVVCYLPMDTPRNVARFLKMVNPAVAIFVKYEFWGNYLSALGKRGVPTYLISGVFRQSQLFFKPYGRSYLHWLDNFSHLFVQDAGSRRLLEEAGIRNVTVAGDTRFDRVTDIMRTVKPIPEIEAFCGTKESRANSGRLLFMAGSSWPADEAVYSGWLSRHPGVKAVIAPHEFDRTRLDGMVKLFGPDRTALLSAAKGNPEGLGDKQVLIIDCFGMLASAYSYADFVYVGGGFGAGLHNINEAAVYGVPVIYGPNHSKFIEAEEMKTLGGGIAVGSRESFERVADRLLYDRKERQTRGKWAGEYIREKTGATPRIFDAIFKKSGKRQ